MLALVFAFLTACCILANHPSALLDTTRTACLRQKAPKGQLSSRPQIRIEFLFEFEGARKGNLPRRAARVPSYWPEMAMRDPRDEAVRHVRTLVLWSPRTSVSFPLLGD